EWLENLLQKYTPKLGEAIFVSWKFPHEIAVVPKNLTNIYRKVPKLDLTDIVLVAKIEALNGAGLQLPVKELNKSKISAYERINLDPNQNLEENEDLQKSLQEAKQFFA